MSSPPLFSHSLSLALSRARFLCRALCLSFSLFLCLCSLRRHSSPASAAAGIARSLEHAVRRRDIEPNQKNGAGPAKTSINQPALCLYLAIEGPCWSLGQAELADGAEANVGRRGRFRSRSIHPRHPCHLAISPSNPFPSHSTRSERYVHTSTLATVLYPLAARPLCCSLSLWLKMAPFLRSACPALHAFAGFHGSHPRPADRLYPARPCLFSSPPWSLTGLLRTHSPSGCQPRQLAGSSVSSEGTIDRLSRARGLEAKQRTQTHSPAQLAFAFEMHTKEPEVCTSNE